MKQMTFIVLTKYITICLCLATYSAGNAQNIKFSLEVDKDTLRTGEYITVTYILEGARGEFVAPEFNNMYLVGGPNYSSEINIVQGEMNQKFTYSYIFQMLNTGDYLIPEASVRIESEQYYSPSTTVHVVPDENWDPANKRPEKPLKKESSKNPKVTEI